MSTTSTQLKKELAQKGVRLPHGYAIVKRKPRTKTATKKKVVKKATATKRTTAKPKAKSKARKAPTAAQKIAQAIFKANSAKARRLVKTGAAKNLKSAWAQIKK